MGILCSLTFMFDSNAVVPLRMSDFKRGLSIYSATTVLGCDSDVWSLLVIIYNI